jgi:phage shock protein C
MTEPAEERPQAPAPPRRLRRSRRDRLIGGVCGGIARYLDVDPVIIRVAAVALALSGGFGVVLYVVSWIVMPDAEPGEPGRTGPPAGRNAVTITLGAVLLGLGSRMLLREWMPPLGGGMWGRGMWGGMWGGGMVGGGMLWPVLVVAVGAWLLASAKR